MPQSLEHVGPEMLRRLRAAPDLFCGLDYDGTLAPLAPTPEHASPYVGTAAVIRRLACRRGVRVAIVTGRPIADVRGFLDVSEAYYVGIHGLEIQRPGEPVEAAPAARRARALLPGVVEQLDALIVGRPGLLIEDKGAAVALHYRLANEADAAFGRGEFEAIVAELIARGEALEILTGHEVVEVRPAGIDKGRALCDLLSTEAPRALAVYIGDDQTDEDAFLALPQGSVTIRVGPADVETAAAYTIEGPAEVHDFLQALARS